MKKVDENKYPNSATLFRFCKEALEIRYEGNVKVIDQDVGAILGYDPADCSHWKKGKKNIRSLPTLRNIAEHLKVDERLLIDIASGRMSLEEAIFEFKGYGDFNISGNKLENLKKDFFKSPGKWHQGEGDLAKFEKLFNVKRNEITNIANKIITMGNFKEAPIYIPELLALFTNIKLEHKTDITSYYEIKTDAGITTIFYKDQEIKPVIRFIAAKQLFKHLCGTNHELTTGFIDTPSEVLDVQSNIFATSLLIPDSLLKSEVANIDHTTDLVTQLANTFWVSKSLMNKRLQDYMENI